MGSSRGMGGQECVPPRVLEKIKIKVKKDRCQILIIKITC
jgi:hypothetical protein